MGFWSNLRRGGKTETRSAYTRTDGDMLIQDNGGLGWITWNGYDSGGGAYPIGPNGPWPSGGFPFQPIVTRATSLITSPLTAAPFKAGATSPRWVTDPMLLRPDNRYVSSTYPTPLRLTRSQFWTDWIRSAIWWGEGAFIAIEDEQGQPVPGTMRLINTHLLGTARDSNNMLHWTLAPGEPGQLPVPFDRDGYLTLGPNRYRLTVLRNPHSPVDSEGRSMGVFQMSERAFKITGQIESYTSGTFRSGIPSGYLKNANSDEPLNQEEADELKRRWLENHGGDRRSIAVLNASTEFHPISMSPVDAALAEVKRMSMADVAMAFGLDPATLSAQPAGGMTYQNLRDAWSNHRDFGLAPWIAAVQDTLSALVASGKSVTVDLDGFANPTEKERYEAGEVAVRSGLLTKDEWRAREGLPPLPEPPAPPPEEDE